MASGVLILIALLSLCAPFVSSYDPDTIDLDNLKEPPNSKHLFGTDNKGRDILSRILYGGRISISISLAAALFSMTAGLIVGLCSGYFGGRIDMMLMSIADIVLSFPALLLAIAISVILPAGIHTVVLAIVAVGWASFARLIRGSVLILRESTFVDAARALGCGNIRILFRHLMPQCLPIVLVMTGLKLGGYLLTEASLSFLGLGAQPPTATWGSMINANRAYLSSAPWMVIFPGVMIAVTALSFNILGDALRDKYGLKIRG
jgi:ABC-type dipeptide/oligopeptide/nickel transport system permease subunit